MWAIRTSPTRATGFSSFKLLFDDEAVTLAEFTTKSLRTTSEADTTERHTSLDLLEEHCVQAIATMIRYTEGVTRTYNRSVKVRSLAPVDMVLKRVANPTTVGKLETKWEGPYIIISSTRAGTFRIVTLEG